MTVMTPFLRKTGRDSGKEERRPRWRLYNERSRRGWYSDTLLKTDDRGDALKFPPTTFDNISALGGTVHITNRWSCPPGFRLQPAAQIRRTIGRCLRSGRQLNSMLDALRSSSGGP